MLFIASVTISSAIRSASFRVISLFRAPTSQSNLLHCFNRIPHTLFFLITVLHPAISQHNKNPLWQFAGEACIPKFFSDNLSNTYIKSSNRYRCKRNNSMKTKP